MKKKKVPFVRVIVENGFVTEVIKQGKVDVLVETTQSKYYDGKFDTTFPNEEENQYE